MKKINKVYLCGLGAVGSAYAAQMFKVDSQLVTVIADAQRIEHYRKNGVAVNDKVYPFKFVSPAAQQEPAELILLVVKQHQLTAGIEAIRPFVGKDTIILSLLNGITSETIIGQEFGMEKLLYSFVVGIDAVRERTKTHCTTLGRIVFGEENNQVYSPKVLAVKELFDRAGVPYEIPDNMLRQLWWKFMMNAGVNQVSAVLRAPYGMFKTSPDVQQLFRMAASEVMELAGKLGIKLTPEDIEDQLKIFEGLSPYGKTSMLQDVEAGRPTEVEFFGGTTVKLAEQHGVKVPVNEVLWRMIRAIEANYNA